MSSGYRAPRSDRKMVKPQTVVHFKSNRSITKLSAINLPPKRQSDSSLLFSLSSKIPAEILKSEENYQWSGQQPLLDKEFAKYERVRRIDLYNKESYNELTGDYSEIIEQQIDMCLVFEMETVCDHSFCDNHDFETQATDIGWFDNIYYDNKENEKENLSFFQFYKDGQVMIEDYTIKLIEDFIQECVIIGATNTLMCGIQTEKGAKPQVSENVEELAVQYEDSQVISEEENISLGESSVEIYDIKEELPENKESENFEFKRVESFDF